MMLSIRGLYQILAYMYEIIIAYSIKSLMVVPFMNLLKSTLSPIPCKCPVSELIIALKQYRLYHSNDTASLAWLQVSLFTWLAIPV